MQPDLIRRVEEFHGHMCPGLAMGIRAAEIALEEIGKHASDEEVVAIVETDMCAVDAIQFLTGCTFGKGNLIHRDYGKNAYTFIRRSDGKAIRIVTRPDAWGDPDSEHRALFAKVRAGKATPDQRTRFHELHAGRSREVLEAPLERLFTVSAVRPLIPEKARVHASVQCEACGEAVMETRIRRFDGRNVCVPCFDAAERPTREIAAAACSCGSESD